MCRRCWKGNVYWNLFSTTERGSVGRRRGRAQHGGTAEPLARPMGLPKCLQKWGKEKPSSPSACSRISNWENAWLGEFQFLMGPSNTKLIKSMKLSWIWEPTVIHALLYRGLFFQRFSYIYIYIYMHTTSQRHHYPPTRKTSSHCYWDTQVSNLGQLRSPGHTVLFQGLTGSLQRRVWYDGINCTY